MTNTKQSIAGLMLLLICCTIGSLHFYLTDGGGQPAFTVQRNPFYMRPAELILCEGVNITITNPTNGSNYYFPSHTINLTTTIFGIDEPSANCYYKVNAGSWNSFAMCLNGVNKTYQQLTLPRGNVTIITLVEDDFCLGGVWDAVWVNVYYKGGTAPLAGGSIVFWISLLIILFVLIFAARKRNILFINRY